MISRTKASRPLLLRFKRLRSRIVGEEGEACDEEGVPDVPMEHTSSGSGAAGDAARPVAGTAKKRRCLRSADVFNEVVERERDGATLHGGGVTLPSFVCSTGGTGKSYGRRNS